MVWSHAGSCPVTAASNRSTGSRGKPPLLSYAPGVALAAIGTLAFGAVLGPEGPLIALGSVVGIAMTRLARAGARGNAVLGDCGGVFGHLRTVWRAGDRGRPDDGGCDRVGRVHHPDPATRLRRGRRRLSRLHRPRRLGRTHTQALTVPGLPPYTRDHLGDLTVALAVGVLAALLVVAVRRLADPLADSKARPGAAPARARRAGSGPVGPNRGLAWCRLAGRPLLRASVGAGRRGPGLGEHRPDPDRGQSPRVRGQPRGGFREVLSSRASSWGSPLRRCR